MTKPINVSNNTIAMTSQPETKLEAFFHLLTLDKFRNNVPVVAVLRLQGVIGKMPTSRNAITFESVYEAIETAFKKPNLTAVCLIINSPGGAPVQAELIADRIISLSKETGIAVYSFVEDVAASGGYWLACAGDEIYASKSSILGSIGVISSGFGFNEAISKLGIERRVYSEGKNKSVLDPFLPEKAADVKILHAIQKQVHQHFIDYVKSRRKACLTQDDDILFNGAFWAGETAVDFGLIDGIDNIYNFVKNRFGDKVKIEYIKPKESWFKKKILGAKIDSDSIIDGLYNKMQEEEITARFKLF